ncbi:MAG: response regulator transcription factor [Bryobacteraceae bacterium]
MATCGGDSGPARQFMREEGDVVTTYIDSASSIEPGGSRNRSGPARVGICESQPITAAGLRALLEGTAELEYGWSESSPSQALQRLRADRPHLLVLDKAFGVHAVEETLGEIQRLTPDLATVIWGTNMSEAEALRFLQAGARGIVRKDSDAKTLIACLRSVAEGANWMDDSVFRDSFRPQNGRSDLTARERQVLDLVERGLKNKEIARELGIRPGTVKIHLKHIFEKTGVRGRYGLALAGMKSKGLISVDL